MPSFAKRPWVIAAVLIALVLGAAVAWMRLRAPAAPAVQVQAAPLVRTLQFSARVATLSRVDVGATITGRVAEVRVREGDAVRAGQALVRLESGELRAALAQAEAGERQAQARLAGLRSTGRVSADAALSQAEATLRNARAELARAQKLVDDGFISASRLDEARRAVAVAQAQHQAAQAQRRANADSGTEVTQAQAQLAVARAATLAARARLEQADIVAPADARVLVRQVEPGQIVQPGKALLSLALAGPTQLVAQVDERFLDQLAVGQPAAAVADAFPGQRFAARVLSLAPSVDAQRGALEVKFALVPPAPDFLREDMTLSVEVVTGRREQALVLPLAALRGEPRTEGGATVLVAQEGVARERTVRLGMRTLDAAEVVQGLSAGELALLGPDVRAGDRVSAQPTDWKPGSSWSGGTSRDDPGGTLGNLMGR